MPIKQLRYVNTQQSTLDLKSEEACCLDYSFTNVYRGKNTRQLWNAYAYSKAHSRKGSTKPPTPHLDHKLPSLPSHLINLAIKDLPDTYLFRQALQSANNLDESDLAQWDADPPYHAPQPLDTPAEARWTQNLIQVVHGRRSRMEKEEICKRAMKYSSGGAMDLCAELSESVDVLLRQWATLHSYVDGMHDCERHCMMAQCLLQWRS